MQLSQVSTIVSQWISIVMYNCIKQKYIKENKITLHTLNVHCRVELILIMTLYNKHGTFISIKLLQTIKVVLVIKAWKPMCCIPLQYYLSLSEVYTKQQPKFMLI